MVQLPDIPAWRQAEITSTDRECEPNVPTIFAIAGKKFCSQIIHANIKIMHMKIYAKSQLSPQAHTQTHTDRFGRFQNGGHTDWLLEQQVIRMHFVSDNEFRGE